MKDSVSFSACDAFKSEDSILSDSVPALLVFLRLSEKLFCTSGWPQIASADFLVTMTKGGQLEVKANYISLLLLPAFENNIGEKTIFWKDFEYQNCHGFNTFCAPSVKKKISIYLLCRFINRKYSSQNLKWFIIINMLHIYNVIFDKNITLWSFYHIQRDNCFYDYFILCKFIDLFYFYFKEIQFDFYLLIF